MGFVVVVGSLIKIINYSPASYAQILVGKNFV
jgi:hypothetical protein